MLVPVFCSLSADPTWQCLPQGALVLIQPRIGSTTDDPAPEASELRRFEVIMGAGDGVAG